MNQLIELDRWLFLLINGMNSAWADVIMYQISGKFLWLPLYAYIIVMFFIRLGKKQAFIALGAIGVAILVADQGSVQLFKDVFERLRPCHEPSLEGLVHTVNKCGGKFGFISSHAANTAAIAFLVSKLFKNRSVTIGLFAWAALVSYSRVYLGVHYPADVLVGMAWGVFSGFVAWKAYTWVEHKWIIQSGADRKI